MHFFYFFLLLCIFIELLGNPFFAYCVNGMWNVFIVILFEMTLENEQLETNVSSLGCVYDE